MQNLAARDEIMDHSSIGSNIEEDDDQTKAKKYINACYINGLVRNYSEKSFIACSAPIPKTTSKFWQMVWENKVKLIVMLCPEFEREKEEPMNYCLGQKFKDADVVGHEHFVGPENNKEFIKIKLLSREQIGETLILRRLELTMNSDLEVNRQNSGPFEQQSNPTSQGSNVSMIVEHLNCIGWQDDTADQSEVLYNDIDEIVKIISKHRDQ
tara:strand:+ start:109 stop:741 length:633 start_codon:yes stop_codon:yes gene_type:complete